MKKKIALILYGLSYCETYRHSSCPDKHCENKIDYRESIRLMNEDIDVLSLGVHLTNAGATYNLSQGGPSIGNFYVPIRGW